MYDNNYPSEIRKVIVESATETWTYRGAAISSGSTSSTWSGVGAGSMDLTSMASRQGPFKVSLGGTKGVKGLNYSVIVTQKGNTSDMMFSFEKIIAYASQFFTLQTGDMIFTGTPAGVGAVKIGDQLEGFLENEKVFVFEVK